MGFLMIGGCSSKSPSTGGTEWEYNKDTKYGQVKQNMTTEEVVKIMGCEGKKAEPFRDAPNDTSYVWKDVDGRETSVVFRDGKAIARFHLDAGTETVKDAPSVKK
jgi:hypothetical protein